MAEDNIFQSTNSGGESEVEDLLAMVTLPKLKSDLCQRQARKLAYKRKWLKEKRAPNTLKHVLSNIDTAMEEIIDSCEESDGETVVRNTNSCDVLSEGDNKRDDSDSDAQRHQFPTVSFVSVCKVDNMNTYDNFDGDDEYAIDTLDEIESTLAVKKPKVNIDDHEDDVIDQVDLLFLPNQPRDGEGTLWADIRKAAYDSKMNTTQIDAILTVLSKHKASIDADLPQSYKTLMKTSNESFKDLITVVSGHQYYYYDLAKQLRFSLSRYPEDVVRGIDTLELVWNTDGLPLYNSRRFSSWPVLCYISNLKPRYVFEVVLTAGDGKPTDLEYLVDFISDLKVLMENGLQFRDTLYNVAVKAAVCDAPARATIKCTKQFMARFGCGQCEKKGEHDGKRMVWVGCEGVVPRTDDSFRAKRQPEYHLDGKNTPLLSLDIDMVSCFPPDFMHQAGGCMKKILLWVLRGPRKSGNGKHSVKMSAKNIDLLDERIKFIAPCISHVFARKLRTTIEVANYKYTELRQLLLYTGKVLFLDLMACQEQYDHFLKYSVACSLMTDTETAKECAELTRRLMNQVVGGFSELYGNAFMTYNAHANLHFPSVAACHGSLDNVSAYPFENHLGHLKKFVTSSHNPLVAMMKGVERRQSTERGKTLRQQEHIVKVKPPDNIYIDHRQHECYEALSVNGKRVRCKQYRRVQPFFHSPVDSKDIGCYSVVLSDWRFISLKTNDVLSLRRGLKISLFGMPGLTDPDITQARAVFMAVLHNQQDALY